MKKKPNLVIVTEYLSNGSLDQIINLAIHDCAPEIWDDTQKLITLYGIASGIAFLHSNNILMDFYFKRFVILDYQMKKKKSYIQYNILPKGSPLYMAPEIFDSCNYSKASDVFLSL